MGFFRRAEDEDDEQVQSRARIEAGGIPIEAETRLRALAAEGAMFTSGLSVNEFALLSRLGPQPLAQVMGASVIRTGWQYLPPLEPGSVITKVIVSAGSRYSSTTAGGYGNQSMLTEPSPAQIRNYQWHADVVCELQELTDAWRLARRRALDRLWEEARQVGAGAVVGVHLSRGDHDLARGTIEYVVTGTAIRIPDAGSAWPTLTDLSVQDYWRLLSAGYDPVGFVSTTAVVFASPSRATRVARARSTARSQELDEISRAFRAARETVRARLRGQVADAHGVGAVGVEVSHSVRREKLALGSSLQAGMQRGWHRGQAGIPYFVSGHGDAERRGWMITMHAAGTAIRRHQSPSAPTVKTAIRMGDR